MCIDIQLNEKKKMGDKRVDEEVEIVEAHIKKGKILRLAAVVG